MGRNDTGRHSSPAFLLVCMECDAGDEFTNKKDAVADGWAWIRRDVTGIYWNDTGLCPNCQMPEIEDVPGQMEMFA